MPCLFEFPLFSFYYRSRVLVHLFFSEVCSRCSSLFGKTFSSRWIFTYFKGGSRKVTESLSDGFCLFFPLNKPRGFACPFFSCHCHFVTRLPVRLSILASSEEAPTHQPSSHPTRLFSFISCLLHFSLLNLHVISWHFVLTWPLSLSLSRSGVEWRSCTRDTGFCAVVVEVVMWVCQGQMLMATRPGGVPCREVRQALL